MGECPVINKDENYEWRISTQTIINGEINNIWKRYRKKEEDDVMVDMNKSDINKFMDNFNTLVEALGLQNDFILRMFSDKRIPSEVKDEYAKKYNELKIKTKI